MVMIHRYQGVHHSWGGSKTAALRIAQKEIQEAFAAQFARTTARNCDTIRGTIMRAFFKHGFDPRKTDTVVRAMRSYQQVARESAALYRRNAAKESGERVLPQSEQELAFERVSGNTLAEEHS
jgi:hypothetical protein